MISATGTNTLKNVSSNTISGVRAQTSFNGLTVSTAPTTTVNDNVISGAKAGASATNGIVVSAVATTHIVGVNNNTVTGLSASSSMNGIQVTSTGTNTISGNNVSNLTMNSNAGNLVGIQTGGTHTSRNNTITGLNAAVAGASTNIWGIFQAGSTAGIIDSNRLSQFTSNATGGNGTASGLVSGIYVAAGSSVTVRKNQIFNLKQLRSSLTNTVNGLHIQAATSVTATNNYISDLRADSSQNPDGIRGISVTSTSAASNYNLYYNTVYLNASSLSSGFGSSGIYHAGNASSTVANLVLRNNIITNVSTPSGAGLTVALRRGLASIANYGVGAVNSNNNAFYAGIPSATRLLYFSPAASAPTP
jgi:parallel beta-helix repeat protein